MEGKSTATGDAIEALGREIREGRYPSGQALPSERQLCERFGVSRMTVRVVLARLERDGLLYRRHGVGTFARPPAAAALPVALWLQDLGKASSPYLSELIGGAEAYLSGVGAHVTVTGTPPAEWPAPLCKGIAGVIVVPVTAEAGDIRQIEAYGLRCVTVLESDLPGPVVGMDPRGAARAVTQRLLELGHRRFALISGHRRHVDRQKRLGIGEALAAAGIALGEVPDRETHYALDAAREAAEALLGRVPRPTALICFDDTLALQALSTAQRAGLRVPGDVSITGFNDSPFSALVSPPISTVRLPVREAGALAARLVYQAHADGTAIESAFLPHELVWRESAGPVPVE